MSMASLPYAQHYRHLNWLNRELLAPSSQKHVVRALWHSASSNSDQLYTLGTLSCTTCGEGGRFYSRPCIHS